MVGQPVAVEVEGGDEAAHGGGLEGADLAGDQADAAFFEQEGQAGDEFFLPGSVEQVLGRQVFAEGSVGKAVELGNISALLGVRIRVFGR